MNEETMEKTLSGEVDIAKMGHDEFVELLKCLSFMYVARVMNCVDASARYDKEWTALSNIFNRVVKSMEASNNSKTREVLGRVHEFLGTLCRDARCDDHCSECIGASDLADDVHDLLHTPPRNCDVGSAEEQSARFDKFCHANINAQRCCGDCPAFRTTRDDCELVWAQMPYEAKEGRQVDGDAG